MKFEDICDSISRETKDKRVVLIVGCAGTGIQEIADYIIKDYIAQNGGVVSLYHSHDSFYHEKITVDKSRALAYKGVVLHNNFDEVKDEFKNYSSSDKIILSVQLPVHGKVRLEIIDYIANIFTSFTLINVDRNDIEFKYEEIEVIK